MNQKAWMQTANAQEQVQMKPWHLSEPAISEYHTSALLANMVNSFAPINLKDMDSVALLNRIDSKFVMPVGQLLQSLPALQSEYRILTIAGQRMNHYRTLYFDTSDFYLYNMHVNERADRFKVRSREYVDSHISFLEVKHKTRKDRTIKERISTDQPVIRMNPDAENWLQGVFPFDSCKLEPKLWNTFTRITLVNKRQCERVTVDVDLDFHTDHRAVNLKGIAVVEVKLDGRSRVSPFQALMRAKRIHPQGFSKYCIGVSMLFEQVKKNSLKSKIMWIDKVSKGL